VKIAQYIPQSSWGDVVPETLEKGMGGTETALVNLGEQWARAGHEVINFVPVSESRTNVYEGGSVTYCDPRLTSTYLSNFNTDVLVSWEEPRIFGVPAIRKRIKLGVVEMQVAHMVVERDGINYDSFIDNYFVLSNWASDFLKFQPITEDKVRVFPNGVDLSRYEKASLNYHAPPYKFYYSSSPDRGLHHLLKLWPKLLDIYPGSELHVAYGIEHWAPAVKWGHFMQSEIALDVLENIDQPGVVYHGKIGQTALAKLQMDADAWLYPCDTMQPTETGCIAAVEAGASYSPMIITNADCLESEYGDCSQMIRLPFDEETYISAITQVMDNENVYSELSQKGREKAEERSWDKIANGWIQQFDQNIN
jgi:glycosyltransferase involved in cell wall biosynthesis